MLRVRDERKYHGSGDCRFCVSEVETESHAILVGCKENVALVLDVCSNVGYERRVRCVVCLASLLIQGCCSGYPLADANLHDRTRFRDPPLSRDARFASGVQTVNGSAVRNWAHA